MWVDIRRSPRRPSVRELACRLTTCSHGCLSVRRGGPKMRRWRWDPGFWLSSSLLCVALVSSAWIIAMLAIHCCGLDATIKCGPIIPLELWPTQHSGGKKRTLFLLYVLSPIHNVLRCGCYLVSCFNLNKLQLPNDCQTLRYSRNVFHKSLEVLQFLVSRFMAFIFKLI